MCDTDEKFARQYFMNLLKDIKFINNKQSLLR